MSGIKDALSSAAEAMHLTGGASSEEQQQATGKGVTAHVDEGAGSDADADGTKAKPFATPLAALLALGPEATVLVKKAPTSEPAPGEQPVATDADGYVSAANIPLYPTTRERVFSPTLSCRAPSPAPA